MKATKHSSGISKTQRGIKTDGFQSGKFFEFLELGNLVPFRFGTRLGVSLAAPKRVSKWMGFKMASFLNLEKLAFWCPFVLVLVWAPPQRLQKTSQVSLYGHLLPYKAIGFKMPSKVLRVGRGKPMQSHPDHVVALNSKELWSKKLWAGSWSPLCSFRFGQQEASMTYTGPNDIVLYIYICIMVHNSQNGVTRGDTPYNYDVVCAAEHSRQELYTGTYILKRPHGRNLTPPLLNSCR